MKDLLANKLHTCTYLLHIFPKMLSPDFFCESLVFFVFFIVYNARLQLNGNVQVNGGFIP